MLCFFLPLPVRLKVGRTVHAVSTPIVCATVMLQTVSGQSKGQKHSDTSIAIDFLFCSEGLSKGEQHTLPNCRYDKVLLIPRALGIIS